MRAPVLACLLTASGLALAQAPQTGEDHSAHHPPGSAPAASAPAPRSGPSPAAIDRQMKAMQDMHHRMQAARSPAERAALMDDHMKLMQSGMAMMGQMRGMGMMAPPAAGTGPAPAASAMPGMGGMAGMMGMHQQMERRLALMEQMMQMMVDREAAMPRQ